MTTLLATITFAALSNLHGNAMSQHVYVTDQAQYGVAEKWTPSLTGDCEDYALWMQRELRQQGVRADLWIVRTETNEQHAVAVVDDLVIDIRSKRVVRKDRLPYKWIAPVKYYNDKNAQLL